MATLWKRANGPQYRMLKIVSGAVLNTANAHPGVLPDKNFARGVAKRAVGTLTAQWPEVLAASESPSGKREGSLKASRRRRSNTQATEGRANLREPAPFTALCKRLGSKVAPLRAAGDMEAVDCLNRAIKELAPMARRERGKLPLGVLVREAGDDPA